MANRRDNLPKTFRIVACNRCGSDFQSSGPNHKRCDGCKAEHKREYERAKKRATKHRRTTCLCCGAPFEGEVHAHTKYCEPCALEVHRQQNNQTQLARHHARYKADPAYRLHISVATLVRRSINERKAGRGWESLLGYDVDQLRAHLERQFVAGMTWENYGPAWHVDHILPRASFEFDGPDHPDFKACWALSNLRPLWSRANRQKNAKRLHLL